MPALYDGNGEAAVTFSNDGYVLHGDLFGRGKEDVIVYSGETAWVYSGTEPEPEKMPSGKRLSQPRIISRLYIFTTRLPLSSIREAYLS